MMGCHPVGWPLSVSFHGGAWSPVLRRKCLSVGLADYIKKTSVQLRCLQHRCLFGYRVRARIGFSPGRPNGWRVNPSNVLPLTMEPVETGKKAARRDDQDWNDQVKRLAEDWRQRVYAAQSAHYASAELLRRFHYIIGVPAVVFASIVGPAIFAGLEKDSPRAMVVASVSILAAVLSALQTF